MKSEELVKQIFSAQQTESVDGDFCNLIASDLEDLKVHMSEQHIAAAGTQQYKSYIKSKVKEAAFEYLLKEQQTHSKVKHIKYEKLQIQPYLCSPLFSRKEKSLLFRLRSRTVAGIKADFGKMYGDNQSCPVCADGVHLDTIPNLLSCPTIVTEMKRNNTHNSLINHNDIFSHDCSVQVSATAYFRQVLDTREKLLAHDDPPDTPSVSGPMHGATLQPVQSTCI